MFYIKLYVIKIPIDKKITTSYSGETLPFFMFFYVNNSAVINFFLQISLTSPPSQAFNPPTLKINGGSLHTRGEGGKSLRCKVFNCTYAKVYIYIYMCFQSKISWNELQATTLLVIIILAFRPHFKSAVLTVF